MPTNPKVTVKMASETQNGPQNGTKAAKLPSKSTINPKMTVRTALETQNGPENDPKKPKNDRQNGPKARKWPSQRP